MPSTADELAALTRNSSARRRGSRNQGLLSSKEVFMGLYRLFPRPEPPAQDTLPSKPVSNRTHRTAANTATEMPIVTQPAPWWQP